MADQGLVVLVRLCDTLESEQPDPLCLRLEDLETWRHFETLLREMYRNPPEGIRVCYLDDESDWVELSCDSELAEAVKVTKANGELLQLQVRRVDDEKLITLDNSDPAAKTTAEKETPSSQFIMYIPTTDPGGDVLEPLSYPHQTQPVNQFTDTLGELQPLIYPYPVAEKSENAAVEDRQESDMPQATLIGDEDSKENQSMTSSVPSWNDADKLSKEEKLQQLKMWLQSSPVLPECRPKYKKQNSGKNSSCQGYKGSMQVEPISTEPGSLGKNFIPSQDPFEVAPDAVPMELDQLNFQKDGSPVLTPTPAHINKNLGAVPKYRTDSSVDAKQNGSRGNSTDKNNVFNWNSAAKTGTPIGANGDATKLTYTAAVPKSKVVKKVTGSQPVPMPRNLLMMEGAQSGANAVAIEMPSDCFQGSTVNKEEEIAASGGASSTAASEETGELLTRGDSVAAAVSRENKIPIQEAQICAMGQDPEKRVKKSDVKSKHSSSRKEKESCIGGAKPKAERKSRSQERPLREHSKKSSSEKCERKKKDKEKVTEDVESGEKVKTKGDVTALQAHDFVKHMKKVKKDIHANIVKDVTKNVDKLLRKSLARSQSMPEPNKVQEKEQTQENDDISEEVSHEGIFCDHCNKTIVGIRYKCGNCLDYDLCGDCEDKPQIHDPTHVFLKLRKPARRAGCISFKKYCLLKENIYEAESYKLERGDFEVNLPNFVADEAKVCACTKSQLQRGQTWDSPSEIEPNQPVQRVHSGAQLYSSHGKLPSDGPGVIVVQTDEDLPMVTPMTKLTPAIPVPVPQGSHLEETEDGRVSPAVSDSGSSIVALSPPRHMSVSEDDAHLESVTHAFRQTEELGDEQLEFAVRVQNRCSSDSKVLYMKVLGDETDKPVSNTSIAEDLAKKEELQLAQDEQFEEVDSSLEVNTDYSDDFCILDPFGSPLRREEYEIIGDSGDEATQMLRAAEVEEAQGDQEVFASSQSSPVRSRRNSFEIEMVKHEDVEDKTLGEEQEVEKSRPVEEEKEEEAALAQVDETAATQATECQNSLETDMIDDGLVHKMNDEEKQRFVQLLRAEMDKEYEEELKRRAYKLEQELQMQKEREFQIILEAKEKEAAFENEKLEWVAQQKKEQDRMSNMSRQTSVTSVGTECSISTTELEGATGESVASEKKDADCQTSPEPLSPASHIIQNVASGVSRAASTAFCTAKDVFYTLQAKQNEWKAAPSTYKPPQSNWKPPASNYKPPVSTWTPPKDDYIPPVSKWTPPKSEFIPPNIEWISKTPPGKAQQEVSTNTKEKKRGSTSVEKETESVTDQASGVDPNVSPSAPGPQKMANAEAEVSARVSEPLKTVNAETANVSSSVPEPQQTSRRSSSSSVGANPVPTLATLEIADSALRREVMGMQRLIEMGFANRERNRQLLVKFDNDLEKVVQSLLQEEGEAADHWSFHRH